MSFFTKLTSAVNAALAVPPPTSSPYASPRRPNANPSSSTTLTSTSQTPTPTAVAQSESRGIQASAALVFDDGAASEIEVEPPSRVLEEAVKELMNTGEGKMGRKLELLSDIHRSMIEDHRTKDVFRESGGSIALLGLLSGLRPVDPEQSHEIVEGKEDDVGSSGVLVSSEVGEIQRVECLRMVLWCFCESMSNHPVNRIYFEEHIGFAALSSAVELSELLSPPLCDHTYSFLLSFSTEDFTLSDLYPSLRRQLSSLPKAHLPEIYEPIIDAKIESIQGSLVNVYLPQPLLLLLEAQDLLPIEEGALSYAVLKSLERIAYANQRNNLLLSQLSFVSIFTQRVFSPVTPLTSPESPSSPISPFTPLPAPSALRIHTQLHSIFPPSPSLPDPQRPILLKLLHRLVEAGVSHAEARALWMLVVKEDDTLDDEVLSLIRHAMKSRWPSMVSGWGRSWLEVDGLGSKGFGKDGKGFTSLTWVYVSKVDPQADLPLLELSDSEGKGLVSLVVDTKGQIFLSSSSEPRAMVEGGVRLPFSRWVLVGLSMRKPKTGNGDAVILIDGKRVGTIKTPYPQTTIASATLSAKIGSSIVSTSSVKDFNRWNLGPAYLLSEALPDDLIFLFHHLGPRYNGNFQGLLATFLTYEASTSLNIFLASLATPSSASSISDASSLRLVRALKDGQTLDESSITFAFSAANARIFDPEVMPVKEEGKEELEMVLLNGGVPKLEMGKKVERGLGKMRGEALVVTGRSMDEEVWPMGGCAPLLRLVELAQTPTQLADAVAICVEALRESYKNSEDMEKSHGYEIFARLLEPKMAKLMTVETAKLLFGSLGVNLEKPEQSTIFNATGYRHLVLAFELWSKAPLDLQLVHLSHFRDLVKTSKFKRFNIRQRLFKKMALTRKLLFALRAGYYREEAIPTLISTLSIVSEAHFSTEDTIKPLIAYLVSTLCATPDLDPSSGSVRSGIAVLSMLAQLLQNPVYLSKLHTNLPLHRVLLLLIANHPPSELIEPSLDIVSLLIASNHGESFARKFDTEGGFTLLTKILPELWTSAVHKLCFAILLGKPLGQTTPTLSVDVGPKTIVCSLIFPAILAAFEKGLEAAGGLDGSAPSQSGSSIPDSDELSLSGCSISSAPRRPSLESDMQQLATEFRSLLSTSPSFQKLVKSRKTIAESLFKSSSSFLNRTKLDDYELNQSTRDLRDAIFEMLSTLNKARIPSSLQTEISRLLPSSYLDSSPSLMGTSPGPVQSLQRRISLKRTSTAESIQTLAESFSSKQGMDKRMALTRRPSEDFKFQSAKDRNGAWKQIITSVESSRFSRLQQDVRNRQRRTDGLWPRLRHRVDQERGLWPNRDPDPEWRLDGSEGPLRQRVRLEKSVRDAQDGSSSFHPKRDALQLKRERSIVEPEVEPMSAVSTRSPGAPWEDTFSVDDARTDTDSFGGEEEDLPQPEEETMTHRQRLQSSLASGDSVEEMHNSVRIVGVDALPGLLVLGKTHLYLLDGLAQTEGGEIVEASSDQHDVFSIPGTIAHVDSEELATHSWAYSDVIENAKRNFLFRDVGLELYFNDSVNFLLVFPNPKKRNAIHSRLAMKDGREAASSKTLGLISKVGSLVSNSNKLPELEEATMRWVNRQISNFAYIVILNQIAGRTPNDVTQFPVFPWVLRDYTSDELDFTKPETFRDLSVPMGAMTPSRRESAAERYANTKMAGEVPFHYGTHFSSSMIVAGFLIRQSPFTEMFKVLQGGQFDLADRLFSSIPKAWESASSEVRGDVRELIPSFYSGGGEFLINENRHDFGAKQSGGIVDDVELPPWARDDPLLFITKHRAALESNYVSTHLEAWIDLTFGHLQHDQKSLNCYHPFSYAGAIDLDKIKDPNEKAATVGIIHNFGQTPRKIFTEPHPRKHMFGGRNALPVGRRFGLVENYAILIQSAAPVNRLVLPIATLQSHYTRLRPFPSQRLPIPGRNLLVEWGFSGGGLRVYDELHRLICLVESSSVSTAVVADSSTIITGSMDGVLSFWTLSYGDKPTLELTQNLSGLGDVVFCTAVSKAWSILLTGSKNGIVSVFDLNRKKHIRTLYEDIETSVHLLAVNESNGNIGLCHSSTLAIYTLNGRFIADVQTSHPSDPILSMAFFDTREWASTQVIATGHSKGKVVLWELTADGTPAEERATWALNPLRTLHLRNGDTTSITALRFHGEGLMAGDAEGRVWLFALPDGGASNVDDSTAKCMNGEHTSFGILEQRRFCGGCGGCFCGTCCQPVPRFESRFCEQCRVALALGMMGSIENDIDLFDPAEPRRSFQHAEAGSRRGSAASLLLEPGSTNVRTSLLHRVRSPSPSPFSTPGSLAPNGGETRPRRGRDSFDRARTASPSRPDPLELIRSRGHSRESSAHHSPSRSSPLATPTQSRPASPRTVHRQLENTVVL